MTLSFLRSRSKTAGFEDAVKTPLAIQPPVETEIWRRGPYTKLDDVAALYRAASAAGGAIVTDHRD